MWLINTHTGKLKYFSSPDSPELGPKGYAVLSHCWGDPKDEQSFQATKALETHDNPRDHATEKIKNFCILTERLGYDWGWADTCCIDKTSSSDLSEAINSMFRYYSLAKLCIVFLHDVPNGCELKKEDSEFRKSRWHKRGWTLQELIAPKEVVFYSCNWEKLSTKDEQAPLLEEITSIPKDVLSGKKAVTEVSVAARMSWAAYRETSKEEDEAYCLLGILKVDMYTSYGEGRHAFYRLQEELIKRSTDTSLFAWGKAMEMADLRSLQNLRLPDTIAQHHDHDVSEPFLFASSPACFRSPKKSGVNFAPSIHLRKTGCAFDISGFLTFTATQYGILAHFPVAELKSQRLLVAFIACSRDGHRLGLVLKACANAEATSPNGIIYDVSFPNSSGIVRLASLTREEGPSKELNFEWRDIYIRSRPSAGSAVKLPDLKALEEEEEEFQTSPPPATPPPSADTSAPSTSTHATSPQTAMPLSAANEPPSPTDVPPLSTSAPATSVSGGSYTLYAPKDAPPSTSTSTEAPSPSLGMQTPHLTPDAAPPSRTTDAPASETKERSATADAPRPAVSHVAPSAGQEQIQMRGTARARGKESGLVAWVRRLFQRTATTLGIPVTESS